MMMMNMDEIVKMKMMKMMKMMKKMKMDEIKEENIFWILFNSNKIDNSKI
jgi:hypothetical protein